MLVQQVGQVRPGVEPEGQVLAAGAEQLLALGGGEIAQAGLGRRDGLRVGGAGPGDLGDAVGGQAGAEGGREVLQLDLAARARALRRVVDAAVRVRAGAARRPAADQVQVGRQGPGVDRLEHVILQDEVLGVGPVVRDLPGVVVAHHVRRVAGQAHRRRRLGGAAAPAGLVLGGPDETVHLAAVDIGGRFGHVVAGSAVHQARIVVRLVAAFGARVGHAHGELAVPGGDAVGTGIGTEERVERPVLLHDDHHVPDLADAGRGCRGVARLAVWLVLLGLARLARLAWLAGAAREARHGEAQRGERDADGRGSPAQARGSHVSALR